MVVSCEVHVNYTTFFSKNNPFSKFFDFCLIDQILSYSDLYFVRKDTKLPVKRGFGGLNTQNGGFFSEQVFHIIMIETKNAAFSQNMNYYIYYCIFLTNRV